MMKKILLLKANVNEVKLPEILALLAESGIHKFLISYMTILICGVYSDYRNENRDIKIVRIFVPALIIALGQYSYIEKFPNYTMYLFVSCVLGLAYNTLMTMLFKATDSEESMGQILGNVFGGMSKFFSKKGD